MVFQLSIPAKISRPALPALPSRRQDPLAAIRKASAFRSGEIYSILMLAMTKRKPGKFSAAKAVKANARERVGQPKPARIIDTEPRTGRAAKHKSKLEEVLRQEE
jgi:hypothetical protein